MTSGGIEMTDRNGNTVGWWIATTLAAVLLWLAVWLVWLSL